MSSLLQLIQIIEILFHFTELLPSSPEGVQVEVLSEKDLNVTWDKPAQNSASITEYAVNVTMLKSFDNNPMFGKNIEDQNSSWVIVTPHSVQVKVRITNYFIHFFVLTDPQIKSLPRTHRHRPAALFRLEEVASYTLRIKRKNRYSIH